MPAYDFKCPSCLNTQEFVFSMHSVPQRFIDYCGYCDFHVLWEKQLSRPQINAMPRALRPENRVYEDKIDRKARIEADNADYERGWEGINASKPEKPKKGDLAKLHRQLHGRR